MADTDGSPESGNTPLIIDGSTIGPGGYDVPAGQNVTINGDVRGAEIRIHEGAQLTMNGTADRIYAKRDAAVDVTGNVGNVRSEGATVKVSDSIGNVSAAGSTISAGGNIGNLSTAGSDVSAGGSIGNISAAGSNVTVNQSAGNISAAGSDISVKGDVGNISAAGAGIKVGGNVKQIDAAGSDLSVGGDVTEKLVLKQKSTLSANTISAPIQDIEPGSSITERSTGRSHTEERQNVANPVPPDYSPEAEKRAEQAGGVPIASVYTARSTPHYTVPAATIEKVEKINNIQDSTQKLSTIIQEFGAPPPHGVTLSYKTQHELGNAPQSFSKVDSSKPIAEERARVEAENAIISKYLPEGTKLSVQEVRDVNGNTYLATVGVDAKTANAILEKHSAEQQVQAAKAQGQGPAQAQQAAPAFSPAQSTAGLSPSAKAGVALGIVEHPKDVQANPDMTKGLPDHLKAAAEAGRALMLKGVTGTQENLSASGLVLPDSVGNKVQQVKSSPGHGGR